MRWKKTVVSADHTIADAIRIIDDCVEKVCLVVDKNDALIGTVTDGDVRRGLIRSLSLESPVIEIMRREFTVAKPDDGKQRMLEIMRSNSVRQLPIINAQSQIVGLTIEDELLETNDRNNNRVILMAGGLGHRLMPMTENRPKPLLKVGGYPVLETILKTFIDGNFYKFYLSVNYRAEMIKEHFGNGDHWNVNIQYLEEDSQLGTAGALGLLPVEDLNEPLIVMNGDVLTNVNFNNLLDFHKEQGAQATMCVREYDYQVPFGVVTIDNQYVVDLEEKPVYTSFVNAGIYVLEPEILKLIVKDEHLDMTDLFKLIIGTGMKSTVFPVREYWIDVGKIDDFQRANYEFSKIFP